MNEKKLTDEEIINCFELCCVKNIDCDSCPYDNSDYCGMTNKDVLGLLKKQKAEIERLTEENEYLDGCAKQFLADYQKCEVEVAELQKEVDELTVKVKSYEYTDMFKEAYIVQLKEENEQAVKDTAKAILQEAENLLHECAMEYANAGHKDYFGVCENISWKVVRKIAKEKGVEVE